MVIGTVNTIYIDADGKRYFVSSGLSTDGHTWMIVTQKNEVSGTHRIKSIPIVENREEAQGLLDTYAAKKKLKGVC
jgi:hypothetical protein